MTPEQAQALLRGSTVPQPYLVQALSAGVVQQVERAASQCGAVAGANPAPCTSRESTDVQKLNKTERRFYEYLWARIPFRYLGVQSITLKIGDDCRYTPDFVTMTSNVNGMEIYAWEVKGFMRDDALVKLKVAARMYQWICFKLVRWNKETVSWDIKDVKP